MNKRKLVLEDGSVFEGVGFGADNYRAGELIFQTGMCGYQEILSDLAYCGQLVMMTYPLIGNCGINRDDFESLDPAMFGFVVKDYCESPSNFRNDMSLDAYMKLKGIPGIADIDTREITRKIRDHGTLKAIMCNEDDDVNEVLNKLKQTELACDCVKQVSTQKPFPIPARGKKVVMIDLGCKYGIIRELGNRKCDLIVVPFDTTAKAILALRPDGIVISNGPGNPADIAQTASTVKELFGSVAMLGIGMGHEIIGMAAGAKVKKMKSGHHANSTPIRNLKKQKVEFTAQNHEYVLDEDSLKETGFEITHKALNDDTVEGIYHDKYSIIGVQFNPEATPGADDTMYIFDEFMALMKGNRGE